MISVLIILGHGGLNDFCSRSLGTCGVKMISVLIILGHGGLK